MKQILFIAVLAIAVFTVQSSNEEELEELIEKILKRHRINREFLMGDEDPDQLPDETIDGAEKMTTPDVPTTFASVVTNTTTKVKTTTSTTIPAKTTTTPAKTTTTTPAKTTTTIPAKTTTTTTTPAKTTTAAKTTTETTLPITTVAPSPIPDVPRKVKVYAQVNFNPSVRMTIQKFI